MRFSTQRVYSHGQQLSDIKATKLLLPCGWKVSSIHIIQNCMKETTRTAKTVGISDCRRLMLVSSTRISPFAVGLGYKKTPIRTTELLEATPEAKLRHPKLEPPLHNNNSNNNNRELQNSHCAAACMK